METGETARELPDEVLDAHYGLVKDVMAVRSTGCALLSSCNPQEVLDFDGVAQLALSKSSKKRTKLPRKT